MDNEQKNNVKYYLIFDTETTGFPIKKDYNYPNPNDLEMYDPSRIIELAYIIVDQEYNIISTFQSLVKIDFPVYNTDIHGIENIELEGGIEMPKILDEVKKDFEKVDMIVAHNIEFDYNILLSECYRYGNMELYNIIKYKKRYCTMKKFRWDKKYNAVKYPKLIELYRYFYGKDFEGAHRALNDCYACLQCFQKMYG